jgi:hypothetical protein
MGHEVVWLSCHKTPTPPHQIPWKPFKRGISQQRLVRYFPNLKLKLRWPNQTLHMMQIKRTSNGRRSQNIESRISHKPLVWASPNLKLKLRWRNQKLHICKLSRPQSEDDHKIIKGEYLSNHWWYITQIWTKLNFTTISIEDDLQWTSNGRRPQNIKNRISQHPLVQSYPNFKLKLRWPNKTL